MTAPSPATLEREKDDEPITLAEACDIFRGKMTVSTLRAEVDRGNLTIFKLGRRLYTTKSYIREMIAKCHVAPKARASTSTKPEKDGLSETERASVALAALEQNLEKLKKRSPTTSRQSTDRRRARLQ